MESLWKKIRKRVDVSQQEREQAQHLVKEYELKGYLKHLNRELLDFTPGIICDFFYRLSLLHSCQSPVSRKRDSRWLSAMDITSFQIHGSSSTRASGNFLKAAMLLPALRTQAVQLAPFTQSEEEHPDHLLSHSKISTELLHPLWNQLGLSAEEQLQCFVEAAHLCGLVLGFDLSYYLSRDAEALYRRPELFRWINLDKTQMYVPKGHLSYNHMLSEQEQNLIVGDLKKKLIELESQQLSRRELNRQLRREGFFPVPLNQDSSRQIPLFIVYDPEQQEAIFTASSETTGLAAFKFYQYQRGSRDYYQPTIDYFSRIFPLWQKKGFDFLYLDRVLNPYEQQEKEESQQESPDKGILEVLINKARETRKRTAVMASGSFDHLSRYLETGFTSLVDQEDPIRLDRSYMERAFRLQKELKEFNSTRKIQCSLLTRISLAEYNSPTFNQKVHLEHFCCRFMNCGKAGRRKFEMMGINDGSSGYSAALTEKRNLIWREDRAFLDSYHILEDIYLRHQQNLNKGILKDYYLSDHYAWWVISAPSEILVALISVENDEMISPPLLEVDIKKYLKNERMPTILEYDFLSTSGNLVLSMTGNIEAMNIPYRGYRLYSIK